MKKDDILKTIDDHNVGFIRLQFTDINGLLKSFAVSAKDIETLLSEGQSFDGSSVTGYGAIEESDFIVKPDPGTFTLIPWRREHVSARMICDIYKPNGRRYDGDPRYIAQKAAQKAKDMGYLFNCGPELEFFIFGNTESGYLPMDTGGYFDSHPGEAAEDIRRDIAENAEKFGLRIEVAHHEVAPGQHEIDFRYGELVETADRLLTLKMLVKGSASRKGYLATFMPKPIFGENGSGMHVHQSLWDIKNNCNAFYDENSKSVGFMSELAQHFIGGQLKYGRVMSLVLASWPNSYKRLVPGYEAPVHIAWAHRNRSPMMRVPDVGKRANAARVEIRCPDPAGNPYIQLAVLCYVGLEGIKQKIECPQPVEENVYNMSFEERKRRGIQSLPETFADALAEFEGSIIMKEALGDTLFNNLLTIKRQEWEEYRTHVTQWEVDRYIGML
ncbi:MAG: hypothetical protein MSIBF_02115 [Candidatus Altiarchaeales archaeon IMC4]|nr:MAG: hypothetical protein MSIBF_02115 [Candidatus Altiarchaeales archaeon IMC4]